MSGGIAIRSKGGDALVADPLSQFASTTSAQLAGVISDKSGTGLLVLQTSPTFVTPTVGKALATTIRFTEVVISPSGTTAALNLTNGNNQTLDVSAASGNLTVTVTKPTSSANGRILFKQHATVAKDITVWAGDAITWIGDEPDWLAVPLGDYLLVSYSSNGTNLLAQGESIGAVGPQGPQGPQGIQGVAGNDGAAGPNTVTTATTTDITGVIFGNGSAISAKVIGTDIQAYSANLDEYAAVNPTAAGLALLDDADASAQRTTLGLTIGTNVQAYDADLTSWAAVTRASGVDTFIATPTSANLAALITDETGSGLLVFATSPALVTPVLGTPTSGTLTNCSGLPNAGVVGLGTMAVAATSDYLALAGGTMTGTLNTLATTVRQSGGTAGTDELQISHDGTIGTIKNMNAGNVAGTGTVFLNTTGAGLFVGTPSASYQGVAMWAAGVIGEAIIMSTGGVTLLNVGAGGYFSIRVGNSEKAKLNSGGEYLCKVLVEASTVGSGTPNVLVAGEARTVLTNEGTAAENYHTLPTALAGMDFRFICQDADGIRVTAATGDKIRDVGTESATAGYIRSSTIGSAIHIIAINATEWIVVSKQGTWTIDS